jgi:HEPN domain-containing protein
MSVTRYPPNDPREWLNRARSNLAKAKAATEAEGVYLEDLCFDAQQAAEKALKAVPLSRGIKYPHVHDLAQLLSLVEASGLLPPQDVSKAVILSVYAVAARYPSVTEAVTEGEYAEALETAETVVAWAEAILHTRSALTW